MKPRSKLHLALFSLVIFSVCSVSACAGKKSGSPAGVELGLSCDFLHHTLTLLDVAKLKSGATRKDAEVATIDLRMYKAGPLDASITPDGKLALVSLSAGFFSIQGASILLGASQTVPNDPGTLLFLDLATRKVVGTLDTGANPMGIAITHDGKRAFVSHFSTNNVSVVDIAKKSLVEQVAVGPYSEELALDETGTVGIFSYSSTGNVRTFGTSDLKATLSPPVVLTGDAAGVAFFPGTKTAYVVNAPNPIFGSQGGHTIVDVNDPSKPVVLEDVRDAAAPIAYPALAVAERNSIVVPITSNGKNQLQELKLGSGNKAEIVQTIDLGKGAIFGAYGASLDSQGRVLLAVPSDHVVIVVDLSAATSFTVPWGITEAGPTDLVVAP